MDRNDIVMCRRRKVLGLGKKPSLSMAPYAIRFCWFLRNNLYGDFSMDRVCGQVNISKVATTNFFADDNF